MVLITKCPSGSRNDLRAYPPGAVLPGAIASKSRWLFTISLVAIRVSSRLIRKQQKLYNCVLGSGGMFHNIDRRTSSSSYLIELRADLIRELVPYPLSKP